MDTVRTDFDPYLHDPLRWGASMVHHSEVLLRCFDAVGARSVVEVGAYAGDLTRVLVDWASRSGASATAIDPSPQDSLVELASSHADLELIRRTSLEALPEIAPPDVLIIDGDHNYYTVHEELRVVGERATDSELPLLLFHDVCWPHGRRDDYFAPEEIPAEYRHPVAGEGRGIFPGDPGTRADGLPYPRSADREGGPRNGVLTAVEEFVGERRQLSLAVVPSFFGLGAVWRQDAAWAQDIARIIEPLDRNPLLARLEENRVLHIAQEHALRVALWKAQERQTREEAVLTRMLESSAFAVAERLSRLRVRSGIAPGQTMVSREEIRRAMAGSDGSPEL
ncbi:MAG: class I SAM-dependent methyltransferase [Actinomycetota bacterium]|nr:class I SAM-dependent methyltransferase [Actinomycetota bacterium]